MSNERVDRIEERLAWLERHVTAQDKAMLELHEEFDRLRLALSVVQARTDSGGDGAAAGTPPMSDERPPHY